MNARAAATPICPLGISRIDVRGLAAANRRSTSRLKPMAADRADTMHTTTSAQPPGDSGDCRDASHALASAKGMAKIEWENLIIRP